jgi:protein TonB
MGISVVPETFCANFPSNAPLLGEPSNKRLYLSSNCWYFRRALFDAIRQDDAAGRAKKRMSGVTISFIVHGAIVAGILFASWWMSTHAVKDDKPKVTFFTPPPPPPPPPPGGGKKTQQKKTPKKVKKEFVQPKEVPKEVPKVESKTTKEDDGGVEGGVEGGVKGGVVGGVVGGVLGSTGPVNQQMTYERISKPPALKSGEPKPGIPANIQPMLRGSKGIILCKIKIGTAGNVEAVEVIRSTLPMLDEVVRKHIFTWTFEPLTVGGIAKKAEFLQPFQFTFPG